MAESRFQPTSGLAGWALMLLITMAGGCNSFGKGRLVQDLQNENARLLSEYRAEKQRRLEMEQRLAVTEQRLAESEKLLARKQPGGAYGRLSSNPSQFSLPSASPATGGSGLRNGSGDSLQWQRRPDAR